MLLLLLLAGCKSLQPSSDQSSSDRGFFNTPGEQDKFH
jgi:hypothetical protein